MRSARREEERTVETHERRHRAPAFLTRLFLPPLPPALRSKPENDRSQPINILEVGSGHGKLAFLLVRELVEAWQYWPDLGTEGVASSSSSSSASSSSGSGGGAIGGCPRGRSRMSQSSAAREEGASSSPSSSTSSSSSSPRTFPRPRGTQAGADAEGAGLQTWGTGPNKRRAPFRVVISDFVGEESVEFWESHESLRPYIINITPRS